VINHLIKEEKSGSNANYKLFPKIYPHLQEMGWKKVNDLSHGLLYLAPWAAKAEGEGGIILENGRCDVSLRDNDEEITRMVLNRDFFVDSKKVVSYIKKHGFMRIEGLPLPPIGDRKRGKEIDQTKTSSMKASHAIPCHDEKVEEAVSVSSSSSRLELTGEELVMSTIASYDADFSTNGEKTSYFLLTKLLPLLENIGWRKVTNCSSLEDHGYPSRIYIPPWVNSLCEDGGVMMLNGDKSDVLNKSGERKTHTEKIILNRDYFLIPEKIPEYLRLHGCKRVAEYLIHDECLGPRNRRPVIAVVPSSSNSLSNTVKSTSVFVNENKGKKHPLGVPTNVKAVAVPERNKKRARPSTDGNDYMMILLNILLLKMFDN
jgi:hypothetical protein